MRATRNFSMQRFWERTAAEWVPRLHFQGTDASEWNSWRIRAQSKYLELLGELPTRTPLDAEVEYSLRDDDLVRERVVFQAEEHMSVPCLVLRPQAMKADGTNAAILCCHGHGKFGKDAVMGVRSSTEAIAEISLANYNYGETMARQGFLTIAPDLRCFGERADPWRKGMPAESYCDAELVKGALLGIYTLSRNVWDMKCCLDYLETRPEVDRNRLGIMGLSYGGTVSAFTAAADTRVKATDIICFINPWGEFGIKQWLNLCGSQVLPDVYRWFDTDDIAGLIAPRPLLLEMGIYDDCFPIRDTLKGLQGVQRIYRAAGASAHIWEDVFRGGHSWGANKSLSFFRTYL